MTAIEEAVITETPPAVTFDTLAAVQKLRAAGLDDRQAEAIVTTVSKAMSETVATKADLELQSATMKADLELHSAAMKADLELHSAAMKKDLELTRAEVEQLRTEVKGDMKLLEQSMAALQDKIVLKLGALMVTLTFLLLAVGPFYVRWVLSLMGSS